MVVFLLLLLIPIPYSISRIVTSYSFPFFALTLILYYVSFRLPGLTSWLAAASLTLLLLGLNLSFLWNSGFSNDKIIGGLLPFRDAFDFYNGAKLILSGHVITGINESAAWRPLYAGFLSSMLMITGQTLQWTLAIQAAAAGICFTLSATYVRKNFGAAAGAIYISLLFFYIQRLVGTAYTETLGLALGALSLVLLMTAAFTLRVRDLVFGLVIMLVAVSERAGTFFVFPLLVLWSGWAFRGKERFSIRHAGLALLTITATYLVISSLYNKVIVEPGVYPFGNFAFTLYGQVVGGAGYHKAFEELGVRNPAVIFRAAERFFFAHPLSFFLGAAKAYRDFFLPSIGALSFGNTTGDLLVWVPATGLLCLALFRVARKMAQPDSSLLIAVFIGILLSIPFLPPIDGGIRIYASTIPFLFILPAIGAAEVLPHNPEEERIDVSLPVKAFAVLLTALAVFVPILILLLTPKPVSMKPICAADRVPFVTVLSPGSYIDLNPEGTTECGTLPELCLHDFQSNRASTDPSDEATYDGLTSQTGFSTIRIFPGNDLVNGRPHIFVGQADALNNPNNTLIQGCATETLIKGRPSIYSIQ